MGDGARGFGEDYWRHAYANPGQIDGAGNAADHAAYLKALLYLDMAHVGSVVDLGCGLGRMLHAVVDALRPTRALGIEPSAWALQRVSRDAPDGTSLRLEQVDLAGWCARPPGAWTFFDLGLCSSVLQYLDDDEIDAVLPELARRVTWLYLTVPTDVELARMSTEAGFVDPYARPRSAAWYRARLGRHFVFVGSRLLESRRLGPARSPFSEAIYRFDGLG